MTRAGGAGVRRAALASACACVLLAAGAAAQPAASAGDDARPSLTAGVEVRRDRLTWHFDNPSSFDTPQLVPHFFEQAYDAELVWIAAAARYRAGLRWETDAGVAPARRAEATDFDTFTDPDGTVIVSGTSGTARQRGFRIAQTAAVGRIGPAALTIGYRFRLDTADFDVGHQTVTRSGALASAGDVFTRETTSSAVHEVTMGARVPMVLSRQWEAELDGELAPAVFGRLVVRLPDKYPGQDLVFVAKAAGASARFSIRRRATRWPIELSADAGRTWSYRSSAGLTRSLLGASATIGRAW